MFTRGNCEPEADDEDMLSALQAAARVGTDALDRGEFKEFETVEDLLVYLNGLSEKVSFRTPG